MRSFHSTLSVILRQQEPQARIVGGNRAQRSAYPFSLVSLQDWVGHSCGGSVVAPDMIMSAAHCAGAFDRVLVGIYNLSDTPEEGQEYGIVDQYIHRKYDPTTDRFDVMLIKLDRNITRIDPIRINDDAKVPIFDEKLSVVGWGATSVTPREVQYDDILNEVELSYIGNARCRTIEDNLGYSLGDWIYQDMMCAGAEEKDSCYGDSGGPIFKLGDDPSDTIQVGVTSWGLECASHLPGVYHRTSFSFPWIREALCQLSDMPPDYLKCNTESPTLSPAPSAVPTIQPSSPPLQDELSSAASTLICYLSIAGAGLLGLTSTLL